MQLLLRMFTIKIMKFPNENWKTSLGADLMMTNSVNFCEDPSTQSCWSRFTCDNSLNFLFLAEDLESWEAK